MTLVALVESAGIEARVMNSFGSSFTKPRVKEAKNLLSEARQGCHWSTRKKQKVVE
jgi:hypothetical protein